MGRGKLRARRGDFEGWCPKEAAFRDSQSKPASRKNTGSAVFSGCWVAARLFGQIPDRGSCLGARRADMKIFLLGVVAVALVAGSLALAPDIVRYIKIRSM